MMPVTAVEQLVMRLVDRTLHRANAAASSSLRRLDNVVRAPHVAGPDDAAATALAENRVSAIMDEVAHRPLQPALTFNPEAAGRAEAAASAAAPA
jgi:phosphoglycerate dehydrogenase-like enzyme